MCKHVYAAGNYINKNVFVPNATQQASFNCNETHAIQRWPNPQNKQASFRVDIAGDSSFQRGRRVIRDDGAGGRKKGSILCEENSGYRVIAFS